MRFNIPLSGFGLPIVSLIDLRLVWASTYLMIASNAKTCILHEFFYRRPPIQQSFALTLEQQPPKMSPSITPTASHCGIVSMNIRPINAMILEDVGLSLSIPYICAFSSEGAALISFGRGSVPSTVDDWRSRKVARRRGVTWPSIELEGALPLSVLGLLAIVSQAPKRDL